MKLTKTDIYAILATIALIVAMWYVKHNSNEYQRLNEELNDYQVERGQIMLELSAIKSKRDSLLSLYEQGKAATPDVGTAQDIVESLYLPERKEVVRLDANGTVERMAWINKADSLLND
jgi:hypothetical protein